MDRKAASQNTRLQLSTINYQPATRWRLASGNGGHDADLVLFLDDGGFFFEEADVFVVDEDVHEAADVAGVVDDTLSEAREGLVEAVDDFADIRAGGLDDLKLVGELAEWGRGYGRMAFSFRA
jgi:hypothetical protein